MKKERKAVIFGTGSFAETVDFYLRADSGYEVAGFSATGDAGTAGVAFGRPVVDFERVTERFPPDEHDMFVAVGYAKLNRVRQEFCDAARKKGYKLLTYVCSRATFWGECELGDNVFVFEDNTIQPFTAIGDGSILWSGNHIGHRSRVGRYCFLTSHVVISGHCSIGDRTFVGVNATVADGVAVGEDNLIGAGALLEKRTKPGEAYLCARTKPHAKGSRFFFRW